MSGSKIILSLIMVAALIVGVGRSATPTAAAEPSAAAGQARTAPPRKAVVLFSYQDDWWCVIDENKGIVEGLAKAGYVEGRNIEITRLYMNTKTVNKTSTQMEAAAIGLSARIKEANPDVLLIMDDDALQHVGAKQLDTDLPIVFAGINFFVTEPDYGWVSESERTPLADSLEHPGHNITGVLERISFKPGFKLLQRILPEAKTALFLSDNSITGTAIMRGGGGEAELEKAPLRIVDKVYTDSFEELKAIVLDYQDKVDSIVLFAPWTLEDKKGNHAPHDQVVRWMLQNNKHPGVAYLDILAEEGYLCGVTVDMVQQGVHAGVMAGRILNGEKAGEIPISDPVANRIMINLARADQLGIEIPFEVLKSADVVFKKMTAHPEYRMSR
ncbi:MAG: hypothetical protein GY859_18785 [Desulfobacterales bacterium]|nr:hypothetical protein [Desulfobacterales bacterium]